MPFRVTIAGIGLIFWLNGSFQSDSEVLRQMRHRDSNGARGLTVKGGREGL